VELVEPHAPAQIRAEFPQKLTHPPEDEIAFAPATRSAEQRKAGWSRDLFGNAAREVEGLMPAQKDPRPGLHRIGIVDRRAEQLHRFDLQCRHPALRRCVAALRDRHGPSKLPERNMPAKRTRCWAPPQPLSALGARQRLKRNSSA